MARVLTFSVAGCLLAAGAAVACLHPPRDSGAMVEATGQEAILFWNDGREELILKADYKVRGDKPVASLGWVLPVPALPDTYGVVSPKVFDEVRLIASPPERVLKGGGTDGPRTNGGVVVAQAVTVGEYDIKALNVFGDDAPQALNTWLADNGFDAYPAGQMKFYTDRKWGFLAIKVHADKADKAIADQGGLRPLRVGFASAAPVYPVKFQSARVNMPVTVYAFTPRPAAPTAFLEEHGFTAARLTTDDRLYESIDAAPFLDRRANPELGKLAAEIAETKFGKPAKLFFTKITGKVNREGDTLSDWSRDFELKLAAK